MIEALDLITKSSIIKKDIIKFLKKVDAFNNNNFFYLIKFKSLKCKLFVIMIV